MLLQRDVGIHLLGAQRIFLAHHRRFGRHLGVLYLAALVLDGHLSVQLVLAYGAFVLNRGHAAQVDGVVCGLQVGLARLGLQCPGNVGRWLDGKNGYAQYLQTQGCDFSLLAQAGFGMAGQVGGRQQGLFERQALHLLLDDDLHLHTDAVAQFEGVVAGVAKATGFEGEIHQPRGQ